MADISVLLRQAGEGDRSTESALLELIQGELHTLAAACMQRESTGHILQPTALVNEAYLRLLGGKRISFSGRAHFFSAASRVMRQILVDYARAAQAGKRQGERVDLNLDNWTQTPTIAPEELIAIDNALSSLREISARCADVVELRFFGGLDIAETASTLSVSEKTIKREWQFARAWLEQELRTDRGR